jgi:hypothetical protein
MSPPPGRRVRPRPNATEKGKTAGPASGSVGSRSHPAALAALLALLLAAGPALAQAQARLEFGSVVRLGDPDVVPARFLALPQAAVCYADTIGDGTYGSGEVLYLRSAPCPAVAGRGRDATDIRLAGPGAGLLVQAADSDHGRALLPLNATPVVLRAPPAPGAPVLGHRVYLHFGDGAVVAKGDLRLTAQENRTAGSLVSEGDRDLGAAGTTSPLRAFAWDADGDGKASPGDAFYLDATGDGAIGLGDVRLLAVGSHPASSLLGPGDPEVVPSLKSYAPAGAFCFVDRDGDGDHDPVDQVYYKREGCEPLGNPPSRIAPGDLRLSGNAAGTFVAPEQSDHGVLVWQLPGFGNLRYADLDLDGRWSRGDTLYLHTAAGRSTVTEGDLRLTPFGSLAAGTFVGRGDSDLKVITRFGNPGGDPFDASPARTWLLWDVVPGGLPGPEDVLYIDIDADGQASLLDVRLTPFAGEPAGALVDVGSRDARPTLAPAPPGASLCRAKDAPAGTAPLFYLARLCGPLAGGDLRLAGPRAGTRVTPRDAEANASSAWVEGINPVRFFDADASGTWTRGDTLYVHLTPPGDAIRPGDLRLTWYGRHPPGTLVATGDDDLDLRTSTSPTLAAVAAHWRAWDVDGDGLAGGRDVLYLDADASGTVTPGDVRLTALNTSSISSGPALADQVVLLQRTVEALERAVEEESAKALATNASLARKDATIAGLERALAEARAERDALRNQTSAPPPRQQAPGVEGALALAAVAGAAVAWGAARRRQP